MSKTLFVTYSEMVNNGIPQETIDQLSQSPALGFAIQRRVRLNDILSMFKGKTILPLEAEIEIQGRGFDCLGHQIKEVEAQSCLKDVLKKGDILLSLNGAQLSFLNKNTVYIKDQTVFSHLGEFLNEGEPLELEFFSEVRSDKSTMPMGQQSIAYEYRKATVTCKLIYEITDPKLIARIEKGRITQLPKLLKKKIFNQDHAIDQVYKRLKIYFAGLKDEAKPIGSYLLVGPTGTGKTELAKLLAQNLGFAMVRIDMSEYGERHTVSRLIGSPPSYIGYGDKTILEKEIGNTGRKVVLLLDEMEKAHPDLQQIFLQAMDNSRITLANGVEVDFNNTLILMTSNLGTVTKNSLGLMAENKILSVDMNTIRGHFLPEFMGRLSGVITFNPLNTDQAHLILEKFIKEFNQNQLASKKCSVEISQAAREHLVKIGFNQLYGARPLKNALQGDVFEKIADLFLFEDKVSAVISVDYINGEFTAQFKHEEPTAIGMSFELVSE